MDAVAKKPKVRTCYVCGREYGLSSFEIHLKQCKQLWIAQEEKKPLKERKPVPEPPTVLNDSDKSSYDLTPEELEAQNRAAAQAFEQKVMEKCQFCGRTFNPERLAIHNRSCTADNPAKAVGQARPKDDSSSHEAPPSKPKESAPRKASTPPVKETTPQAAPPEKPLAGTLSSNRKQRSTLQSPLSDEPSTPTSSLALDGIKAKLDYWEKTALAMVQDIRDLKAALEKI
ncbi:hypothetical protein LEN26_015524 [Aphanomyces euteiches]|uniref:C2HC/C3H-type domain-containing protein n=1 Tax=Aphanomyces euteiches TaxID=100861 RepID=A0A6G0WSX5_9STRA|nr:hypothetical protein Ae201684_012010 [Aphanomyces euteiches]KAH9056059.1 hypothetical protein Ae201684P_021798 [Aphanomyces euteiches]KAH9102509.1 hypothetical protein LEN26_015524 [Aphanomyces euteiches]KAH9127338.1 hypothetical protein AeMF1_002360 [Aphanomyces euteiches]KAH9154369.1 hypothetical protein AeRB84_003526 [Aphanomyces euteiches]